jgi:acetolactate synthase small subunit
LDAATQSSRENDAAAAQFLDELIKKIGFKMVCRTGWAAYARFNEKVDGVSQ